MKGILHSQELKVYLFIEVSKPSCSAYSFMIEDLIIPQLPNFLSGHQENLHKERIVIVLRSCKSQPSDNINFIYPMNL